MTKIIADNDQGRHKSAIKSPRNCHSFASKTKAEVEVEAEVESRS
jgi:hypothetical protein